MFFIYFYVDVDDKLGDILVKVIDSMVFVFLKYCNYVLVIMFDKVVFVLSVVS